MCNVIKEENLEKVCKYVGNFKEEALKALDFSDESLKMGLITKETHEAFFKDVWRILNEHNKIMRMLMPITEV